MKSPELSAEFTEDGWVTETEKYAEAVGKFIEEYRKDQSVLGETKRRPYDSLTDLHFSDATDSYLLPTRILAFYKNRRIEKIKAEYRKKQGGLAEVFLGGKALEDFSQEFSTFNKEEEAK